MPIAPTSKQARQTTRNSWDSLHSSSIGQRSAFTFGSSDGSPQRNNLRKSSAITSSCSSRSVGAPSAQARNEILQLENGDDKEFPADEASGDWLCALIESRAREVGLVSLHRRSLEFELMQFTDSSGYHRAISSILGLRPAVVVLCKTGRGTQLHETLSQALNDAHLPEPVLINRQYFDETAGQQLLEEANVIGLQPSEFQAKFVACAALHALWRFAESSMDSRLLASATRVLFRGAADSMVIDVNTARLLELVVDSRGRNEKASMFGLFSCRTPGGARLLRQTLLQPPATLAEIAARQAVVGALLDNEVFFYELQRLLPAIGDVDLLAARLTAEPRSRGPQWCKAAVRTAVRLRHALAALPSLGALRLQNNSASEGLGLLVEALTVFNNPRFPELLQQLDRVLDSEGAPPIRGQGSMAHAALMYSVRPGASALLDIARQTWNEALEQVHGIHRRLAVKYPELNVRLEFTERRGWYLSHASQNLPSEFIQTAAKGGTGRLMSTTRELNTENFKLRQAEREILTQTLATLSSLFGELSREAPLLYQVAHAASLLDLLQAFTGYALLSGECVKPELSEDPMAPIAVKAGRHPLMERILARDGSNSGSAAFKPLDFFIGEACHFQVVTGPNGGGKSTYLRTVAQMVVLAQIGCYVPAQYATMRIVSSLFTRVGTSDSLEASASTFLVEMQETAHILSGTTCQSLILIDELGRGTSHTDGLAICWAVCESLLEKKVYTLFATHFFEICRLQALFPGLRNMHLQSTETPSMASGVSAIAETDKQQFSVHHVTSLEVLLAKPRARYGLRFAEEAGLPASLVENAHRMAVEVDKSLSVCLPRGGHATATQPKDTLDLDEDEARNRAAQQATEQLLAISRHASIGPKELADVLRQMQRQCAALQKQ